MDASANRTISLSSRLTLNIVLVLTIIVALFACFYYFFIISNLEKNYTEKVEGTMEFLSGSIGPLLWILDKQTMDKIAAVALENELISGLTIRDHKNRIIFSKDVPENRANPTRSKQIYFKGERVGKLDVTFSRSSLSENLKQIPLLVFLFWLITILTLTLFTKIFIHRFFRGPIEAFTDLSESYRQQPGLSPLEPTPYLEFQPIESVVKKLANEVFMQMQELKESEKRFRTLFETAPTIILHVSPDGEILNLNPEAEKFFKCHDSKSIDKNFITKFLPEKAHDPFLKEIGKVLEGNITRGFENTVINANGAERIMAWDAAPFLVDQSESNGIICMGKDITEQRKNEVQLRHAQKIEAIGTLAAGIAHDFNNMIGTILGNASFVLSLLDDTDELHEPLSDIQEA